MSTHIYGMSFFEGFAWALPTAFKDALGACRFGQADSLYDDRRAYLPLWSDALPHVTWCIKVQHPAMAPGTKSSQDEPSAFSDNWKWAWRFSDTVTRPLFAGRDGVARPRCGHRIVARPPAACGRSRTSPNSRSGAPLEA